MNPCMQRHAELDDLAWVIEGAASPAQLRRHPATVCA